jgi:ABC-type glycerol-3-phosphate transport system substrate-binding protein
VGAAVLAVACGLVRDDASSAGTAGTAGPVTIQFGTRGTEDTKPLYEAAATAYAAKQNKVRVELWLNEPDYYTKLPVAFAGGSAPDTAFTTSRNMLAWEHRGWLGDITKGLSSRRVRTSEWFELAAKEWQIGGKQYGTPQGWGTGLMGVNKTLFRNAGITLRPDFDSTWTHEEFVRLLKQVAKVGPDGNLEVYGITGWQAWSNYWAFGAEILNKDQTKCALNTPEGTAGMQWLYDLAWSHRIMPRPAPFDRPPGGVNMWQSGNAAAEQNGGPHVLPAWPRVLQFEYDVALYPTFPGGRRHHRFYSDGYIRWSETKQPDAALDFLIYLGTEGQAVLEQNGGRLVPAYRPVAEGIFLQGKSPFTKKKWIDALKGAKPQPLVLAFDEINASVNTHQNAVLAQKESPREAVAAIEREVNAALTQYPPPGR